MNNQAVIYASACEFFKKEDEVLSQYLFEQFLWAFYKELQEDKAKAIRVPVHKGQIHAGDKKHNSKEARKIDN